jgi:hypothetical protein
MQRDDLSAAAHGKSGNARRDCSGFNSINSYEYKHFACRSSIASYQSAPDAGTFTFASNCRDNRD